MSLDRFASIASERPELEDQVTALREVLAAQTVGVPLRIKRIADLVDVDEDEAESLLEQLVPSILRSDIAPICLGCDAVMEEVREDGTRSCDLCEEECSPESTVDERCFYLIAPVSLIHASIYNPETYQGTMTDPLYNDEQLSLANMNPWTEARESDYFLNIPALGSEEYGRILECLQRWGLCHIRWTAMDPNEARLRSLAQGVGRACPTQNDHVGEVKSIEPKSGVAANSGDSALELGFHVDGTQHEELPAILVFQYTVRPQHGGFSTFLDMAQVLREFKPDERAHILTTLARADCAKFEKKGMTYEGPIIKAVHGGRAVSCRLRFDGEGDRVCTVNPECADAFEAVREAVMRPGREVLELKPAEGDIIIFDNWRVLHGRREVGGRYQRLHDRMWIQDLKTSLRPKFALGVRGLGTGLMASIEQANGA